MWAIKHKSGTVLFTTKDKFIALNRAQHGWRVEEMSEMNVYLSRPGARIPTYATSGSACFDIYAVLDKPVLIHNGEPVIIPTWLKFDIPVGYALMIYSRSGHGFNSDVRLSNCTGVIDSDYTGELMVKLTQDVDNYEGVFWVNHGDRIAQGMLIPVEQVTFKQINEPPQQKTNRQGGFVSTGS